MMKQSRSLVMALAVCGGLIIPAGMALPAQNAFAATCRQSTHVWFGDLATKQQAGQFWPTIDNPPPIVSGHPGDTFFFTGVVEPNTKLTFSLIFQGGAVRTISINAGDNCVANQIETVVSNTPTTVAVSASYQPIDSANNTGQTTIGNIAIS